MVLQISKTFTKLYDIPIGAMLIVREYIEDGDVVLFKLNKQYKLGTFIDDIILDPKTKVKYLPGSVDIIGCVVYKVETINSF
jgi:hypothetical protein